MWENLFRWEVISTFFGNPSISYLEHFHSQDPSEVEVFACLSVDFSGRVRLKLCQFSLQMRKVNYF